MSSQIDWSMMHDKFHNHTLSSSTWGSLDFTLQVGNGITLSSVSKGWMQVHWKNKWKLIMVVFFYICRTLDLKQGRNHSFNSVLFRPIDRTEMGLHSFRYQFWSISAEIRGFSWNGWNSLFQTKHVLRVSLKQKMKRIQEIFLIFTKLKPSSPQLWSSPLSASESPHVSVSPLPFRLSLAIPRARCHFLFFVVVVTTPTNVTCCLVTSSLSLLPLLLPHPPPFFHCSLFRFPYLQKKDESHESRKSLRLIASHPIFSLNAPFLVTRGPLIKYEWCKINDIDSFYIFILIMWFMGAISDKRLRAVNISDLGTTDVCMVIFYLYNIIFFLRHISEVFCLDSESTETFHFRGQTKAVQKEFDNYGRNAFMLTTWGWFHELTTTKEAS